MTGTDPPGALVVCPTPIGNLGDTTLRALEELRRADAAACEDTRHSRTLLHRHGIDLPLIALHEHNERAQTPALLRRVAEGQRICLLTDAGFPAVSDPGAWLVSEAIAAGAELVVLPGPSAVTTALVASGMAGGGFAFAGFLPRSAGTLAALLDRLTPRAFRSWGSSPRAVCPPPSRAWRNATPAGGLRSAAS